MGRMLMVLVALALAPAARAADTIETWDPGAADVEVYLGYDGVGAPAGDRQVFGDVVLGYGIVPGLSAYLAASLHADGVFAGGQADLALGAFGTPLDTDHVDLDLILDVSAGGAGFSEFRLTPTLELNLDAEPDLASWGGYVRLGLPLFGQSRAAGTEVGHEHEAVFSVEVNPGVYVSAADDHQIFLEVDAALHPFAVAGERQVELGGLALGWNVALADEIELISQVYLDLPQDDEPVAFGAVVGFIATLGPPAAPAAPVATDVARGGRCGCGE